MYSSATLRCAGLILVGPVFAVGCGGSSTAPSAATSAVTTASITDARTLSEAVPSAQLSLLVSTKSGMLKVTAEATWQSSDTAVATVAGGLVQATGPGSATISATYEGVSASASVPVAEDADCLPYSPSDVQFVQNTTDSPPSLTLISSFATGVELLASASSLDDANNLVALFQRSNYACFIGRDNSRSNRTAYIVDYFKVPSGQQTSIAPEDCVSYSASALQTSAQGSAGWTLTAGGTQLAMLDTQFDAGLALALAKQNSSECFIGRGNTRANSSQYVYKYWK